MKISYTLLCTALIATSAIAQETEAYDPIFDSYSTDSTESTESIIQESSSFPSESFPAVENTDPVIPETPKEAPSLSSVKKSISAGVRVENRYEYNNHQNGEENAQGKFVTNKDEQAIYSIKDIRIFPWVKYKFNENISFYYQAVSPRLEWGNKGGAKGTGDFRFNGQARESTLRNKLYYTDITFSQKNTGLLNTQLIRVGGQEFKDPHSIIFQKDVLGASYNGLFLDNMIKLDAGYFVLNHLKEQVMVDSTNKYQSTDDEKGEILYTTGISAHLLDSSVTVGLLLIAREQEIANKSLLKTDFGSQKWIAPHVSADLQLPFGSLALEAQYVHFFGETSSTLYEFEPTVDEMNTYSKKTENSGSALSALAELSISKFTLGMAYLYTSGNQENTYSGEETDEDTPKYQTSVSSYYSSMGDSYYRKNNLQFLTEGNILDNTAWDLIDGTMENGINKKDQAITDKGGASVVSTWAFYEVFEDFNIGAVVGFGQLNAGREVDVINGDYALYEDKNGNKYWYNSDDKEIFEFDDTDYEDPVTDSDIVATNGTPQGMDYDAEIVDSEWTTGVKTVTEAISDLGMEFNIQARIVVFDVLHLTPYFAILMPGKVIVEDDKSSNLYKVGMAAILEF